ALLKNDGANPSTADLNPDRPGRKNKELAARFRADWLDGKSSREATADLLAVLRQGNAEEAPAKVVESINGGTSPQAVWDALFLAAGEMLLRAPNIVALHAVTSTNALHYAYEATANDETRRWLMLQNAAFLPLFRQALSGRGKVADQPIEELETTYPVKNGEEAVAEMFADISRDVNKPVGARKLLG